VTVGPDFHMLSHAIHIKVYTAYSTGQPLQRCARDLVNTSRHIKRDSIETR